MIYDHLLVCPDCEKVHDTDHLKFKKDKHFQIRCECGSLLDVNVHVEIKIHFEVESLYDQFIEKQLAKKSR